MRPIKLIPKPAANTCDIDDQPPKETGDIGFEFQDIVDIVDRMTQDILSQPFWKHHDDENPPRIIVDSYCFTNEGTSDLNVNMLADRLRVELSRSAKDKILFVARHLAEGIDDKKHLNKDAKSGNVTAPPGAEYRLCGNITTLDKTFGGKITRYTQITFEIVDLHSGALAWSSICSFKRRGDIPVQDKNAKQAATNPIDNPSAEHSSGVRVWTDQHIFRIGEKLRIHFQSDMDCFVYIYLESADGKTTLIFPNQLDENNFIQAGRTYTIPDERYGFELTIAPPLGIERIKVLATTDPIIVKSLRLKTDGDPVKKAKTRQASLIYRVIP